MIRLSMFVQVKFHYSACPKQITKQERRQIEFTLSFVNARFALIITNVIFCSTRFIFYSKYISMFPSFNSIIGFTTTDFYLKRYFFSNRQTFFLYIIIILYSNETHTFLIKRYKNDCKLFIFVTRTSRVRNINEKKKHFLR